MLGRSPGWWLQLFGAVHVPVAAVLYRKPLRDIAGDGLVNAVPGLGDKSTAFWFLAFAPALWTSGRLLRSAESSGDLAAQRAAGGVLTVAGVVGSAAMPVSGFWGVAAVGVASLRRGARREEASSAAG